MSLAFNFEPLASTLHAGTLRYQMPIIASVDQYDQHVEHVLGDSVALFKDVGDQRLLAFGSCFAINIGRLLRDRGHSVYTLVIGEEVNSPFNNLQLLKRIFLDEKTPISEELHAIAGVDYAVLRREFMEASRIIFTLGNIFHLEVDGTSTLSAKDTAAVVSETFGQTLQWLREIFGLLHLNTKASIYTSVSPVPVSGYRGREFASAIEADCVSKSQLRAALHACIRESSHIHYIPTFEIFRWLPAHQAFPTFGTDDGNARHISGALLSRVLEKIAG